eukprot:4517493-Pleurochrysis_carterae.AAC.1
MRARQRKGARIMWWGLDLRPSKVSDDLDSRAGAHPQELVEAPVLRSALLWRRGVAHRCLRCTVDWTNARPIVQTGRTNGPYHSHRSSYLFLANALSRCAT